MKTNSKSNPSLPKSGTTAIPCGTSALATLNQLTYRLFLKMADDLGKPNGKIPFAVKNAK